MKSKAAGILILAALALAACWYFLPAQLDSLWLECARMKKKP